MCREIPNSGLFLVFFGGRPGLGSCCFVHPSFLVKVSEVGGMSQRWPCWRPRLNASVRSGPRCCHSLGSEPQASPPGRQSSFSSSHVGPPTGPAARDDCPIAARGLVEATAMNSMLGVPLESLPFVSGEDGRKHDKGHLQRNNVCPTACLSQLLLL